MSEVKVYAISGIDYTAGEQTGYVLAKDGDALLVDASADVKDLTEVLKTAGATLRAILVTHSHFDHTANAARLKAAFPHAKVYASPYTEGMLADGSWCAGFVDYPSPAWTVDVKVEEKTYEIGAFRVRAIYTPGHTRDGVCYLVDDAYLAAGDTVMNDLICGNSNLPTGNERELYQSGQKLWREAPPEAFILGGHVARFDGEDWTEYTPKSTVGRASHRNMINRV